MRRGARRAILMGGRETGGMETDSKPFELDQGGQRSDEVIWRKMDIIRDFQKVKPDKVFGRQEDSSYLG